MNCPKCNRPLGKGSKFCNYCGVSLNGAAIIDQGKGITTHKYLKIILWIGYTISFVLWIIQKTIIPLFYKKAGVIEWDKVSPFFKDYRWPADLFTFFSVLLIYSIIKDKDAKTIIKVLTALMILCIIIGLVTGN